MLSQGTFGNLKKFVVVIIDNEYYAVGRDQGCYKYPRMLLTAPQRIIQSNKSVVKTLRHSNVDSGIERG